MMKKITLLLILLTVSFGFSQSLPIDFESTQPFVGDSGAAVNLVDDGGNNVLEIVGNGSEWDNAQVTFAAPIDLSNTASNTIQFKMKSLSAGAGEVREHLLKFELPESGGDLEATFTTTGSGWNDIIVDMDTGNVTPTSYNKMVVMVDWGGGPTKAIVGTYYVDDFSVGATPSGTDANLSDLQVDAVTIAGFAPGTLSYTYAVPNGTTIVPTVTATPNDAAANAVITPAASLPGSTTVVVTAGDGTTTKTYTVSFGFPIALPFDFETSQPFTSAGDEVGLSVIDDGSGSNDVLQLVGGVADWDSAQVVFTTPIDLSDDANNTLRFTFQSTTAAVGEVHQHGISFQGGGGAIEMNFITTGQDPVDVALDFQAGITDPRERLHIFIDVGDFGVQSGTGGTSGQGTAGLSGTYIVDNIALGATSLSVQDFKLAGFSLYPNPSQSSWMVKTQNVEMSSIQVYDVLGKNVLSLSPNNTETVIDGSSLKTGLYFAQIKTATGIYSTKLVKN
ncbi:T9SS type A sorting domain-containing protein [Algibacter sp.]|uniref:T9SS type A sorting domain-containing protein n=1 Tax=Algibacter sp. TaxID=1872428 RepID=UPI003C73A153